MLSKPSTPPPGGGLHRADHQAEDNGPQGSCQTGEDRGDHHEEVAAALEDLGTIVFEFGHGGGEAEPGYRARRKLARFGRLVWHAP
jgi:hypothetical protein